ncbi:MAG: transposase [Candidatus Zixiibacteriota bacterium]|nr:MAG: transposase [candidate division Zixibacteria bacterium]
MSKSTKFPKRKNSLRLKGYDYSQNNAYFVTICTKNRELSIKTDEIRLIIRQVWDNLPDHYDNIILDEFVVMPNHVHGIIIIQDDAVGADLRSARSLSEIIRAFKSFSTREINKYLKTSGQSFWQRNYYDHVIRDEKDLYSKRKYIRENPLKWELDEENPVNLQIKNNCRGANGYVPGHRGAG